MSTRSKASNASSNISSGPVDKHIVLSAIASRQSDDVILKLISRYPKFCSLPPTLSYEKYSSTYGAKLFRSVFHLALENQASLKVVDALIKLNPTALKVNQGIGSLLLHIAITNKCAPAVINRILDGYPYACNTPDTRGFYPLHLALANDLNIKLITKIYQISPTIIRKKVGRQYPIHIACVSASDDVVMYIMNEWPIGCSKITTWNEYPLHVYSARKSSIGRDEVIRKMIDFCPMALSKKNSKFDYPLHILLRNEPSYSILKLYILIYEQACCIEGGENKYPLLEYINPTQSRINSEYMMSLQLLMDYSWQIMMIETYGLDGRLCYLVENYSCNCHPLVHRKVLHTYLKHSYVIKDIKNLGELNWQARYPVVGLLIYIANNSKKHGAISFKKCENRSHLKLVMRLAMLIGESKSIESDILKVLVSFI